MRLVASSDQSFSDFNAMTPELLAPDPPSSKSSSRRQICDTSSLNSSNAERVCEGSGRHGHGSSHCSSCQIRRHYLAWTPHCTLIKAPPPSISISTQTSLAAIFTEI